MDIQELFIDEDRTIIEGMKQLDLVAKKVLFVQKDGKLMASLTDGDIRRFIISNGNLEARIKQAANYKPRFLFDDQQYNAEQYLTRYQIEAIPILDEKFNILNIVIKEDGKSLCEPNKIDIPVVIMAGGLGTRLYPYTKILPKPLIPVGDTPIIEHIINQFYNQGCRKFFIILNHKKNMIKAYLNESGRDYQMEYVDETVPLGTGGGLSLLKGKMDSTFILSNCDILIEEEMNKVYKVHKEKGNLITMICSLKNFTIPYGIIKLGEDGVIAEIKEKPTLSFFTNTGCYIVEPKVIDSLEVNKKISFPDIIEDYRQQKKAIGIYPIGEQAWLDMGQMDELEKMKKTLEERI